MHNKCMGLYGNLAKFCARAMPAVHINNEQFEHHFVFVDNPPD